MTSDVLAAPVKAGMSGHTPLRAALVLTGHALAAFVRTPTASFFTLVFPVSFLVIVGSTVGNQAAGAGVRVSQFLVAPFMVFGVAEGAFCVLAVGTATLRDSGVLKRLRGTPIPTWAVLASRIAAAVVMSVLSAAVLVTVGVVGYGVQVVWRKAPAAVLTLALGIVCCAALGMAVVALTRSVLATQALTNGVLIPLAFISNVFIVNVQLPTVLDWVSRALPLRHFADAMRGTFDPLTAGLGFAWGDLAAMAAWSVLGATVAIRWFGWEPRSSRRERSQVAIGADTARVGTARVGTDRVAPTGMPEWVLAAQASGRPSRRRLVATQTRHALAEMGRQRLPVFFAVVLPALLLLLFPAVIPVQTLNGVPYADALLAGMVAYGIAVAGYVNLPESVADARGAGVLKRLRATPLPPWIYVAGRLLSSLTVAATAAVLLLAVGIMANDSRIDPASALAVTVCLIATSVCFGALGLMLLTLLPSARTVNAITLGTLIPLSFLSDVFYVGAELPGQLQLVGDLFPLKHAVHAFAVALQADSVGSGFAWADLGVIAGWAVAGLLIARRFPWYEKA
jgi:ABC-type multidrug transport system permease subunit